MKKIGLIMMVLFLLSSIGCDGILKHTVTFNPNGGSMSSSTTVAVEHGKSIIQPTQPVREGYIFIGWFDKKEGGTEWNFQIDRVTGDLTLYAQWKATRMTLESVSP